MKNVILTPLKTLRRKLNETEAYIREWKNLMFPLGNKYYVIGTPEHSNIGDSAIAIAELLFLKKTVQDSSRVKEITFHEMWKYHQILERGSRNSCHFFWHGGGNMGDLWFEEESFRRRFIVNQYAAKPVIFPQTLFYSDTPQGRKARKESIEVYNVPEVTLVAREQKSYEKMKEIYPQAHVMLTPDIVLSADMARFGATPTTRCGVLMVTRNDLEKTVDNSIWRELKNEFEALGLSVCQTDMFSTGSVKKETRDELVRSKMQEFCGAQLIVTDRLHGMVFAALTGTPCIVFRCNNHKVKGTYDWISYLDYIRFAETIEDAKTCIPDLLAMKNCKFDNSPLQAYFDELKEYIQNMVE